MSINTDSLSPSGERKLRLAYFSPLPPQRSGIAEYSEDLLPHLGALADVTVVVGPYRPSGPVASIFPIISIDEFLRNACSFDLPVYQVGNSVAHHGYMLDCLRSIPGILVLHDYCLQYLILGMTLFRGDFASLTSALGVSYGTHASSLATRLLFGIEDPFALSFAGQLVIRSLAVVVHSRYAEDLVRKDFPEKRVQLIPMGVPLDLPRASRLELRAKYGFGDNDFVVASINSPAYNKRLSLVLETVRAIRDRCPKVRLVILSGKHFDAQTSKLLADPASREAITCPGWLSSDAYREFIYLADVVVDLRYPSGAETSASLSRALAFGKAAVVSAQGTFLELPDDICIKVPVEAGQVGRLADVLSTLANDPLRTEQMGKAARQYAVSNCRLDLAAQRYVELANEMVYSKLVASAWNKPPEPNALKRLVLSTTYKTFRTLRFLRTYGLFETIQRVRAELPQRVKPQPADVRAVQ